MTQLVLDDPADRATPEAGALLPAAATGSYDVRAVAAAIVDDDSLLEVRAGWAGNLVTARDPGNMTVYDGKTVIPMDGNTLAKIRGARLTVMSAGYHRKTWSFIYRLKAPGVPYTLCAREANLTALGQEKKAADTPFGSFTDIKDAFGGVFGDIFR